MFLSLRLDERCRSLSGEKWQPVFSICFCSRRDFPSFIYPKHLSPAWRDVTLPEMEFINFNDEYTRWRCTKSICLLVVVFFTVFSISFFAGFFMMLSVQSHSRCPPCPRPCCMTDFIASIGFQCLEFPNESMFTAFRVALLYVLQTDRKTMLRRPPSPPALIADSQRAPR